MTSNSTVVKFRTPKDSPEKTDLAKTLSALPWRSRAQSILDLMGYNATQSLTGDSCCAKTSYAHQMGANSLSSFCDEVSVDEADVINELNALHLSSSYGIPGNSPEDILAEYKQVADILGRDPVSSSEVMDAISYGKNLKITSLKSLNRDLESKIDEGNLKISSLERIVDEKDAELVETRNKYEEKISNLQDNEIKIKEDFRNRLQEMRDQHAIDIKHSEEVLAQKLEKQFEDRVEKLNQDHKINMEALAEEKASAIKSLQDVIDNEMVSLQDFDSVNLENDQLRRINRENLVRIKDYADKLESLENSDYQEIENQMEELREKLSKLQQAYLVMEDACMKYKHYSMKVKKRLEKYEEDAKKEVAKIAGVKDNKNSRKRKTAKRERRDISHYVIAFVGISAVVGSYLLMTGY